MMKLSPARRVLLVIAIVLLVVVGIHFHLGDYVVLDTRTEAIAAILLLLLLSLELADKVIMKRDLEIAREIQNWLVPSQRAGCTWCATSRLQRGRKIRWRAITTTRFIRRRRAAEGGKLLLVVADVAGKSVPAALLMATMQASLRTSRAMTLRSMLLWRGLNRYASAYSLDGRRFTTAILGLYDPASGELTYVNAGHNAPVLRRSNLTMEFLDKGGVAARNSESTAVYETGTRVVAGWRRSLMFTDGVVEAFNAAGEEFGNGRWLDAIRKLAGRARRASRCSF